MLHTGGAPAAASSGRGAAQSAAAAACWAGIVTAMEGAECARRAAVRAVRRRGWKGGEGSGWRGVRWCGGVERRKWQLARAEARQVQQWQLNAWRW